ncbi:MAG: LysM peptidoglycan-binding domain-containing protein [Jatrophihabitantaceae bacterium]
MKPITYTVKKGDNLTVIAAWFHLHGYGGLYERNKAVLGDNPNLIFPGQRITISSSGMTMG